MDNRDLSNTLVVVTGTHGEVGKAVALAFARLQARLVVVAPQGEGLEALAAECQKFATSVLVVPADVTDPQAVSSLVAKAAEEGQGGIDIWVNSAGGGAVGDFLETPIAAHEKIIKNNLLAYMYAAHAVLPYFKKQGEGTLINIVSFSSWFPTPYAVASNASKYGLEGFSSSLRDEFVASDNNIHVCDIYPTLENPPGLMDSAGEQWNPDMSEPCFTIDTDKIAEAVVVVALHPRYKLYVGAISMVPSGSTAAVQNYSGKIAAAIRNIFGRGGSRSVWTVRLPQTPAGSSAEEDHRRAGVIRSVQAACAVAAITAVGVWMHHQGYFKHHQTRFLGNHGGKLVATLEQKAKQIKSYLKK